MSRFKLYTQSNTASDNMVRCERTLYQKESSKTCDFIDLYFESRDKK